jgi:hypothetical protein
MLHSYYLSMTGFVLMTHANLVRRLVEEAPGFDDVIFDIVDTHPKCVKLYERYRDGHSKRPQSLDERQEIVQALIITHSYRPSHQLLYLLAPIWCRLEAKRDLYPNYLIERARSIHIRCTSSLLAILTHGTPPLTIIPFAPFFNKLGLEDWLRGWVAHGGLPTLLVAVVSDTSLRAIVPRRLIYEMIVIH